MRGTLWQLELAASQHAVVARFVLVDEIGLVLETTVKIYEMG